MSAGRRLAAGTQSQLSLGSALTACHYGQSLGWPHVAKRHWLRQQHDNMIGPRILGASAHIVSGSFREPDAPGTNQCWPWLTLLTHLPKSSSHAVTNHNRSTAPASIRAPRRAHPSLSARLSLLLEPDRSRVTRGRDRHCHLGTGICR